MSPLLKYIYHYIGIDPIGFSEARRRAIFQRRVDVFYAGLSAQISSQFANHTDCSVAKWFDVFEDRPMTEAQAVIIHNLLWRNKKCTAYFIPGNVHTNETFVMNNRE